MLLLLLVVLLLRMILFMLVLLTLEKLLLKLMLWNTLMLNPKQKRRTLAICFHFVTLMICLKNIVCVFTISIKAVLV
jgi:hypothetical protein